MRSHIRDLAGANFALDHGPILAIHAQSLKEAVVFLFGPPADLLRPRAEVARTTGARPLQRLFIAFRLLFRISGTLHVGLRAHNFFHLGI